MSSMKKRIPMFLLAIAMMVAMAAPALAAEVSPLALGDTYISTSSSNLKPLEIYADGTSKYLNVVGNYSSDGCNVSTYSRTGDITQQWYVYRGTDNITTIRPAGHLDLAVIREGESDNANCKLGSISKNSLDVLEINMGNLSANSGKIKLKTTLASGMINDAFWLKYGDSKLGKNSNYYNVMWQRANTFLSNAGIKWKFVLV